MEKTTLNAALAFIALLAVLAFFKGLTETRITFKGQAEAAWAAWKVQHNKTYGGPEETHRFNVFKNNLRIVQDHNAQKKNYTLALNQFADLTNKEFASLYTGASVVFKKANQDCPTPTLRATVAVPDTLDWRTQGRVGPVKNQAMCGSCWAFSSTGALEGLAAAKTGKIPSFSEQQLVDCTTGSWGNYGCGGGWVQNSFHYVMQKGIGGEDEYPYKGVDQSCQDSKVTNPFKISGCANVDTNSVDALKQALQNGPVSIYVEADTSAFQMYSSGVVDDTSCFSEGQIDHAVLAVGYTKDAWIVKNSWGSSWGQNGYIQISQDITKDARGICGILSTPNVYPL